MTPLLLPPLAYIGPDALLPLASVVAACGGALLLCWNFVRRAFTWCIRTITGGPVK